MRNASAVCVLGLGRYAILFAVLLLAGCGAREKAHWLTTKPIGYQEVSVDNSHRPAYAIYNDGPKVYLEYFLDRKVSSQCSDWFWLVPYDRISRNEHEINDYQDKQGDLVSIGVAAGNADEKIDLHKIVLTYDGREYRPISVTQELRSEEIRSAVNIAAGDTITWYHLKYEMHVNVRKPFHIEIGGISKGGKDVPSKLIEYDTKDVVKEGEYGEAGCPLV